MNMFRLNRFPGTTEPLPGTFRNLLRDAARYWEPRRIAYNAVLAAVVVAWVVASWPHFRSALTLQSLRLILVLAAIANVCYCSAYLVEIAAWSSRFRAQWLKRRGILWLAGTLVAGVFACYWIADEIYPYIRPG